MNLSDVDAMFARIFGIKPDDPDTFVEPEESREPDLPAPEGWQLPAREIRF